MAKLKVKLTPSSTVSKSWLVIDDIDAEFDGVSAEITVSDLVDHSVVIWFAGPPGSKIDYEIKQKTSTLVKGSSTIFNGKKYGYVAGSFKLAQ